MGIRFLARYDRRHNGSVVLNMNSDRVGPSQQYLNLFQDRGLLRLSEDMLCQLPHLAVFS